MRKGRYKFKQGKYKPIHPEKWINPDEIIYRSGWELTFNKWADKTPSVVLIGSEEIIIPYRYEVDGRMHRYFTDYYMKVLQEDQSIKEFIIEIKPFAQCSPPKAPKRKSKAYTRKIMDYIKNVNKWDATKKYCQQLREIKGRDIEFKIITENELPKYNGK